MEVIGVGQEIAKVGKHTNTGSEKNQQTQHFKIKWEITAQSLSHRG